MRQKKPYWSSTPHQGLLTSDLGLQEKSLPRIAAAVENMELLIM